MTCGCILYFPLWHVSHACFILTLSLFVFGGVSVSFGYPALLGEAQPAGFFGGRHHGTTTPRSERRGWNARLGTMGKMICLVFIQADITEVACGHWCHILMASQVRGQGAWESILDIQSYYFQAVNYGISGHVKDQACSCATTGISLFVRGLALSWNRSGS